MDHKMLVWVMLVTLMNVCSHFPSAKCEISIINHNSSGGYVPAMYIFGDSLSDVGNSLAAKFPPYGTDFPLGPTGRYSNGKVFPDFIADYLGLPYPPAYSSKKRTATPTDIGFNYAYGGCGILPQSRNTPLCWTMEDQIGYFRETVGELEATFETQEELYQHLANSIFIIWAGSNDYLLNYFKDKAVEYNPHDFAQLLVDKLYANLQVLYEVGARKGLVMELGLLGCTPESRGDHEETWCDDAKNQNVTIFNNKLATMMQTLPSTLPDSHFSLAKFYDVSVDVLHHPAKYGFTNVGKPCCPTVSPLGTFCVPCVKGSNGWKCLPLAGKSDEFIFWDGAHPSQASISILANHCIHGSSVCVPLNLHQLAQLQAKPASLLSLAST